MAKKTWTLVFTDIDADDATILMLGDLLQLSAAQAGFDLRGKTIESWKFRTRQLGAESFQEVRVPYGLPVTRKSRGRGARP